ncbi:hypothetical protein Trydic_g5894 [Trypoxylus dichotomus]
MRQSLLAGDLSNNYAATANALPFRIESGRPNGRNIVRTFSRNRYTRYIQRYGARRPGHLPSRELIAAWRSGRPHNHGPRRCRPPQRQPVRTSVSLVEQSGPITLRNCHYQMSKEAAARTSFDTYGVGLADFEGR